MWQKYNFFLIYHYFVTKKSQPPLAAGEPFCVTLNLNLSDIVYPDPYILPLTSYILHLPPTFVLGYNKLTFNKVINFFLSYQLFSLL